MNRKLWAILSVAVLLLPATLPAYSQEQVVEGKSHNGGQEKSSVEEIRQIYQRVSALQREASEQSLSEAQALSERLVELATNFYSPSHPALAQVHFLSGVVDHSQGKFNDAQRSYETVIEIDRKHVAATANLGLIAYEEGDSERALQFLNSALENAENSEVQLALAIILHERGETEKGLRWGLNALNNGPEYSDFDVLGENLWGRNLLNQASIFFALKDMQEAVASAREKALRLSEIEELVQQISAMHMKGKYEEAKPLEKKALSILQATFWDHATIANSSHSLAILYQDQERYREASQLYGQALQMRQRVLSDNHPQTAASMHNLAYIYQITYQRTDDEKFYQLALEYYQQSLEMNQRFYDGDHPDIAQIQTSLASLYKYRGQSTDAEPLYGQALDMRRRFYKGDHPDIATSLNHLGRFYHSEGRFSESESFLLQALEMNQRLYDGDHPALVFTLRNLAFMYYNDQQFEKGSSYFSQASEMEDRLRSPQE